MLLIASGDGWSAFIKGLDGLLCFLLYSSHENEGALKGIHGLKIYAFFFFLELLKKES